MRKLIPITFVAGVALGGLAYVSAVEPPRAEAGMIIGDVIDVVSYAMKGERGEELAVSGKFRAEQGFPVGIVDEKTGEVFIAVYRNPAPAAALETANHVLAPLMGKKVVAQGLIYRAEGINVIRIAVASEY